MNTGPMEQREAIEMMERASNEIKDLRRTIERLAPKAEAWDRLGQVLNLLPKSGRGESEDVAWMLDHRVLTVKEALAQAETAKAAAAARSKPVAVPDMDGPNVS